MYAVWVHVRIGYSVHKGKVWLAEGKEKQTHKFNELYMMVHEPVEINYTLVLPDLFRAVSLFLLHIRTHMHTAVYTNSSLQQWKQQALFWFPRWAASCFIACMNCCWAVCLCVSRTGGLEGMTVTQVLLILPQLCSKSILYKSINSWVWDINETKKEATCTIWFHFCLYNIFLLNLWISFESVRLRTNPLTGASFHWVYHFI